ncbi:uncharacterized protein LOC124312311 [Daphnia pulicaria]|uniref:uncharacterized protein LOC124312311 n=1 Tax=Daphnia pulicaria TaxID=35523 RepID=UPI001EECACCA|nr:uncharacterized protein LOC124312311 [Daphnia pulicaria]
MPPRRELTREEKDEKNRKAREKRSNEDPEAKEVRLAANRERAKIAREEKRRRLNPEEVQVAKNLNAKKAREERQAEAPDERALRQRLDAERKRVARANETQVEHEARLHDQRIRQQLLRQEQAEEENRARLLAEAERQAVFRQEEENRARLLAEAERQAVLRQEEENRARLLPEAERQADLRQDEQIRARLQAEAERQAALRQQEAAIILRAMNQRPACDRPRVVLANDAVAERPARQQHQARKRAADDTETAEEQRARLQAQALRKKYLRRDESEAERSARLQDQALRQKSLRNEESEAERSSRLCEQALRQNSLRKEESEADKWARQRAQALRQKSLRDKELEAERLARLGDKSLRQEAVRCRATGEERLERAMADRFFHEVNLLNETEQEAAERREQHTEVMTDYRATENEEETADRREEDRLRTELQREHQFEREREEEELRARNALQHAEIVPVETADHEAFLREMHLDRNRAGNRRTHRIACKDIVVEDRVHLLDIGDLTKICAECDAKHFEKEMPKDQKFQRCCGKGKVIIPPPKPCPQPLASLLQNQHPKSKQFMKQIRNYNSAHAFASLGANQSPPPNRGPYCYRIHGQIYHQITPLGPTPNPRYADLYFLDSAQATDYRANIQAMSGCCRILMEELDAMLREKNPYALVYKMMRQVLEEEYVQRQAANLPHYTVGMIITCDRRNVDQRRYNCPTAHEIAVVFKSSDGAPPSNRDIRGHLYIPVRGRRFIQINTQKPMCDPMCYPLLFPNGEDGWHAHMNYNTTSRRERDEAAAMAMIVDEDEEEQIDPLWPNPRVLIREEVAAADGNAEIENERNVEPEPAEADENDDQQPNRNRGPRSRVTQAEFYSSIMSIRGDFNIVLSGGALTQQYFVDSYVKTEGNRIDWLRKHQTELHVERYCGLMDYINNRAERENVEVGTIYILPSSFIGSPRAMKQNYQDAMAIVAKFGKPTFFLTFTCNPKWREITANIANYQTASDRPDMVARVFHLKKKELVDDIEKKQVLGFATAHIEVIEFQKRGLPHCHMLIWIDKRDAPLSPEDMDKTICAEIPDKSLHPRLYAAVMAHMIHGPCGAINKKSPCMDVEGCTKKFPKDFIAGTIINDNGYPTYRRRDTGVKHPLKRGNVVYEVDNRWVVPYNPWLLLKYDCHINLESCASLTSVKYIFKYVYKGHDSGNIETKKGTHQQVEGEDEPTFVWDEITTFLDTRYVSAPEAAWRINKFPLSNRSHVIFRLAVHLPLEQSVFFHPGNEEQAVANAALKETTLTAFFILNRDNEEARQYFYREIVNHFAFVKVGGRNFWKRRVQNLKIIGRLYTVSVRQIERFCLRLLLINVKGPTSFENLRTVNGVILPTFKAAAAALNLLEDDSVWERTLDDAAAFEMPERLRQLFVDICLFCNPTDALYLFERSLPQLMEDFIRNGHDAEIAKNLTLKFIQDKLLLNNQTMENLSLPVPDFQLIHRLIAAQLEENAEITMREKRRLGELMVSQLNEGQRAAFDQVMAAVNDTENAIPHQYFLDGPGGTGKTFLYNTLITVLQGQGKTVIAVASTGIASTLLIDGTTYHSQFKIYPPITEATRSKIEDGSFLAHLIRSAVLIISDEATMKTNHALSAFNLLFQKLHKNNLPHGGKVLLLGGDFRQCLPVVRHGNRVTVLEVTIRNNDTWPQFRQLRLTQNMRTVAGSQDYADWLIQLGNGTLPTHPKLNIPDMIEIPKEFFNYNRSLVEHVFGDPAQLLDPVVSQQICSRAILCPKNGDCLRINNQIIKDMPGTLHEYRSIDTIDSDDPEEISNYPTEVLNSFDVSGIPTHLLKMKVGAVIILLKNIDSRQGLCNGTRLIIRALRENLIVAEIAAGKNKGHIVYIPRMMMSPTDSDLPVILKRLQFPVLLAFAMTITKSQGQTFDRVGILLPEPVFSHGQLYVAFSRATSKDGVRVEIAESGKQGKLLKNHPTATEEEKKKVFTLNVVFKEVLL